VLGEPLHGGPDVARGRGTVHELEDVVVGPVIVVQRLHERGGVTLAPGRRVGAPLVLLDADHDRPHVGRGTRRRQVRARRRTGRRGSGDGMTRGTTPAPATARSVTATPTAGTRSQPGCRL